MKAEFSWDGQTGRFTIELDQGRPPAHVTLREKICFRKPAIVTELEFDHWEELPVYRVVSRAPEA